MNSPTNNSRRADSNSFTRAQETSIANIPFLPSRLPSDPGEAGMVKQIWSAMRQCALGGNPHLWLSRIGQSVELGRQAVEGMERVAAQDPSYKRDFDSAKPFLEAAIVEFGNLKAA